MNIDHIKGKNYSPNKSRKADESSGVNRSESGSKSPESKSNKVASSDNLSLSGSIFENEVAFTKKILSNSRSDSLERLRKIKQKINSGAYNNEAVHEKISTLVSRDLTSLQSILSGPEESGDASSTISENHKQRLLENPEVTKKVADRIAQVLRNL